jgi:integrase
LAVARQRAHQALADISAGTDPMAEKKRTDLRDPLPAAVEQFIAMHCERQNRPATTRETARLLRANFVPVWKHRDLTDITKRDVVAILDAIVARGSPGSANHALSAIRKFFNWCVQRGMLDISPCFGVQNPARNGKRERVLTDEELAAVWRAAATDEFPVAQIVHLLILTGQRRGEVAGLRWPDLNLETHEWSLPAALTKANRAHVVPLSPQARRIIMSAPKIHDTYLFPARGVDDQAFAGFNKAKQRIDAVCGFTDWTLHDLRRTAATGMARLRTPPHVIERVLNHASGIFAGVAGVYNRFDYLTEMRTALESWAAHVERLAEPAHHDT